MKTQRCFSQADLHLRYTRGTTLSLSVSLSTLIKRPHTHTRICRLISLKARAHQKNQARARDTRAQISIRERTSILTREHFCSACTNAVSRAGGCVEMVKFIINRHVVSLQQHKIQHSNRHSTITYNAVKCNIKCTEQCRDHYNLKYVVP